jgi:hypothetical protein
MKMADMKEPGLEEEGKSGGAFPADKDAPEYRHTVHLDHHHMKKLGLHKKLPGVGQMLKLHAHARVKEVGMTSPGKPRMTLEIHKMGIEGGPSKVAKEESNAKGMKDAIDGALNAGKGNNRVTKGGYNAASATGASEDGPEA